MTARFLTIAALAALSACALPHTPPALPPVTAPAPAPAPALPATTAVAQAPRAPVTLPFLIVGFRPDYLARGITPHL